MSVHFADIDRLPASLDTAFLPTHPDQVDLLGYLTKFAPAPTWFSHANVVEQILVSAVRQELRETYHEADSLPRVLALLVHPEDNEYGHRLFVEVEYNRYKGWRATYGGKYDPTTRKVTWTCYCD